MTRRLLLLTAMFACGLAGRTGHAANAAAVPDRHVIVVTIDGFAAYLLDDPQAPPG